MRKIFLLIVLSVAAVSAASGCAGRSILGGPDKDAINRKVKEAETLYNSMDWTLRMKAVNDVSQYETSRAEKLLITACHDPHGRVRIEAIRGLSRYDSLRAFEEIRSIAQEEKDGNIQWTALKALGKFKKAEAAPVFVSAMKNNDWMIREAAIAGLLDIENATVEKLSVPAALNALADQNENVRIAALVHLRIADPKIYKVLSRQAADSKNYTKVTYLKAVLKAISLYRFDRETRKAVVEYITHPNADIRVLALRAVKNSDTLELLSGE